MSGLYSAPLRILSISQQYSLYHELLVDQLYGIRALLRVGNSAIPNLLPDSRDQLSTDMLEAPQQLQEYPRLQTLHASHMKCLVKHAHEVTKMGQDTEPRTSCVLHRSLYQLSHVLSPTQVIF